VWVPEWLATGRHEKRDGDIREGPRLIEEIDTSRGRDKEDEKSVPIAPKPKSILKISGAVHSSEVTTSVADDALASTRRLVTQEPAWNWRKEGEERLLVVVDVAKEVHIYAFWLRSARGKEKLILD